MYCGIDVSKGKSNVCILDKNKKIITEFVIKHNKEGLEKLEKHITKETKIGMENSGNYCKPVYFYLKTNGYNVCYVENLKMHNYAKIHNPNIKNDKVDAKLVAYYLSAGLTEIDAIKSHELKDLTMMYYKTVKQNTRYKHMYKSQLATIFPELEKHFSVLHVKGIPNMLLKYPTPKEIANATDEEVLKALKEKVRTRMMSIKFAIRLRKLAIDSVGVEDFPTLGFQSTIRLMLFYNNLVLDMKKQMKDLLEKSPYDSLVNEFGYSTIGVATLAGQIGDIRRFPHYKKFVRFCGLDVVEHTSGSSIVKKSRITKQGNRIVRSYFYNQSLSHLSHKTEISKFFYRLREKGKHPKVAMTAFARKLAVKTYFDMKRCHDNKK